MAPRTRAQRQHASTTRQPVDTTTNSAPPLPNNNSPNDDREPGKLGEVEDTQEEELEMGLQQSYAYVLGWQMLVPQTYDPDTYDPDGRVPWTPEPESEPYDPEAYAAWGRKHFGEEWYKLRETMLQERNIYQVSDPVYLERQRALRVIEHKIEGRPFRPRFRMFDEGWNRLWSRLSKVLPRVQPPSPTSSHADGGDGDTELSGFSTSDATPEPREPTPVFEDPWEGLEYDRKRFCWNEEAYQLERIFLNEERIDWARAKHEDQEGDRQREKELEEIEKVRYYPGTAMMSEEYERRMRHFNHRAEGWTQEQIDAEDRAAAAERATHAEEELLEIFRTKKPMTERLVYRFEISGVSRERQAELAQEAGHKLELVSEAEEIKACEETFMDSIRHRREEGLPRTGDFNPFYLVLGVSKERQAELARMFDRGQELGRPGAQTSERLLRQRTSSHQPKDTSRKTRGGRVGKDTVQPRGVRSRKSAPTPAKVSGADLGSDRPKQGPDNPGTSIVQAQDGPRRSRRLAGLEVEPSPPDETSLRLPSNTRKTNSSGPRSGKLPKIKAVGKGVKPQGISKSSQAGSHRKRGSKR